MDIQYSILHASSKLFFVHSEQHICAIAAFMSGDGMTPAKTGHKPAGPWAALDAEIARFPFVRRSSATVQQDASPKTPAKQKPGEQQKEVGLANVWNEIR